MTMSLALERKNRAQSKTPDSLRIGEKNKK